MLDASFHRNLLYMLCVFVIGGGFGMMVGAYLQEKLGAQKEQ